MAYFNNKIRVLNNTNHIYVNVFWYYFPFYFCFRTKNFREQLLPCLPFYLTTRVNVGI